MNSAKPAYNPYIRRVLFTRVYYAKRIALRLALLSLAMVVVFVSI